MAAHSFIPPDVNLAFFDLDSTVTDVSTDWLWAMWRSKWVFRNWIEILRLIRLNRQYRRGELDVNTYLRFQMLRFMPLKALSFQNCAEKFYHEIGKDHVVTKIAEIIRHYNSTGTETVLITAQNNIIASYFCDALEMRGLLSNRFLIKEGRAVGFMEPYCFGEGKIYWAEEYCKLYGYNLDNCAFYSDSIHDRPLLDRVGYPVAVNPDLKLVEYAREREWPIIHFANASEWS